MGRSISPRLHRNAILAAVVLVAATMAVVGFGSPRNQAAANAGLAQFHGFLVGEQPESGWPTVLGTPTYVNENDPFQLDVELQREVMAAAQVGNVIVLGGNFHQIQLVDGTVIEQKYLMAFDRTTGALVEGFDLDLDREVLSIHADDDGTHVFVGGRFNTVDGQARAKIIRVAAATGVVDPAFGSQPSAAIESIDVTSGGRLFVGGPFETIDGVTVADVAELDPATGELVPAFDFEFEGIAARSTFVQFSNGEVKHVEATPDGASLVVVHRAATVDGEKRSGYAIFDISDPSTPMLTPDHSNTFFEWPSCPGGALPTSGAVSPDGQYLVMGTVAYDLPNCHDAVLSFPVGGGADAEAIWAHQMRDSVFSVAVSDVAVYAAGHFCRIDEGPSATDASGRDAMQCTGSNTANYPDGAWRWQIAALHPVDGTPLDWDPGINAGRGARFLEATDSGLFIGFDGDRVNDVVTGAFASLAVDPTSPVPEIEPIPEPEPEPEPVPVFCDGREATIVGTEDGDLLIGTPGDDVIAALGGNDLVYSLHGDDVICGGDGNDKLFAGDGADVLEGGAGNDRLFGELGRDLIHGGPGRDAVIGGSGPDTLFGGKGNDRILGGSSADLLFGENGRDRLIGGPGSDIIRGGGGNDVLLGGEGIDGLNGGASDDRCGQAGGGLMLRCEILV